MSRAPPLSSRLGLIGATALVMGNMIGSGVFLLPASLAPFGWNALPAWALTITGSLLLAWVIAKLVQSRPQAGGPAAIIGETFGPVPGFMIGWSYYVSILTANVTIAVSVTANLALLVPALAESEMLALLVNLGWIWGLTILNLRGARVAGAMQIGTLLLKLVPLIVAGVLLIMLLGRDSMAALRPLPAEGLSLAAITAGATLTLWALLGFESAGIAADKVNDPARNIPRATLIGTALAGLLFLFICGGVGLALPASAAQSSSPFGLFVALHWHPAAGATIAIFAAISAFGALNGWTLLAGEMPLAMARSGTLPDWLAKTDQRDTPVRALLVSAMAASGLLIINSVGSLVAIFTWMALLSTSATLWLYLGCAAAALKRGVAQVAALLGGLYALWALWGAGVEASGLSLVLMIAGLPLYWWSRRIALSNG
jgi:basic amino acid/polyamine antiporter, APA family